MYFVRKNKKGGREKGGKRRSILFLRRTDRFRLLGGRGKFFY
jgi:hypothetical protein